MIDFFDLFRPKKTSAQTAKERLLIVVSHERQQRGRRNGSRKRMI